MGQEERFFLSVAGLVEKEGKWDYETLSSLPKEDQVEEINQNNSGVIGSGIRLSALVRASRPLSDSDYITFTSQDEIYAASIPLDEALENGILIYKREGAPLPESKGGPVRLVFPEGENDCCNVKSVKKIELTVGKGKDTTTGDPDHDNPAIHGHSHDHKGSHGHGHSH